MKRMKSRYRKRSSFGAATLFLVLVLVAAIVWFVVTSWTGGWLADKIAGRTAGPTAAVTAAPSAQAPTPAPSAKEVDRVTETVRTEGFALYGVQMGAFAQKENAQALLDSLAQQNLYGCILNDGQHSRVLTAVALDREDAILARDAVVSRHGLEALVYELAVPGVSLKVVATPGQIVAMTDSCDEWYEAIKGLAALIGPFETGQLTGAAVETQLTAYAQRLDAAAQQLRDAAGDVTGATVLEQWLSVLETSADAFQQLAEQATGVPARDGDLCSALKQVLVDCVARYNVFVAGNPSGRPF